MRGHERRKGGVAARFRPGFRILSSVRPDRPPARPPARPSVRPCVAPGFVDRWFPGALAEGSRCLDSYRRPENAPHATGGRGLFCSWSPKSGKSAAPRNIWFSSLLPCFRGRRMGGFMQFRSWSLNFEKLAAPQNMWFSSLLPCF